MIFNELRNDGSLRVPDIANFVNIGLHAGTGWNRVVGVGWIAPLQFAISFEGAVKCFQIQGDRRHFGTISQPGN